MGNRFKGYGVDFNAFWNYYRASCRTDYSRFSSLFNKCFMERMDRAGFPQGLHSNTVNLVEKNMARLCRETRTEMLSRGATDAAVRAIMNSFKKWFSNHYAD